ncbi:uncharacterized protein LOC107489637 [Arachis duranensis]|uniref:Uncharacterized protein LOC107489637 n=1 Tax=Arachis duranensis TaxID=130453 RepID=A0A6P4DK90_ARADU|nr:uncharacterized protein LOC107489637 [Arachis duranensis]
MDKAREEGRISGVKIAPTAPAISRLLFADDCIIFLKDSEKEIYHLITILNMYTEASGQRINVDKSGITFGNQILIRNRVEIEEILGLPAWDRPASRLKEKLLSQSGREVLIKSVIQAIPAYAMNVVHFLKVFVNVLVRRWLNFGGLLLVRIVVSIGGVRIKFVLAKGMEELVLKAVYFPNKDFKETKAGRGTSWIWKSIMHAKNFLLRNGRWLIRNGEKVRILEDNWILNMHKSPKVTNNDVTFVKELISEGHGWNINELRKHFDGDTIGKIIFPSENQRPLSMRCCSALGQGLHGLEPKFSAVLRLIQSHLLNNG